MKADFMIIRCVIRDLIFETPKLRHDDEDDDEKEEE
jgi:hypothetical protein